MNKPKNRTTSVYPDFSPLIVSNPSITKTRIVVSNRDPLDISNDCYSVLIASNEPPTLFMFSGKLVRLKKDEHERLSIEEVNLDILRNILIRSAKFIQNQGNGFKIVDPQDKVLRDLLARSEWDLHPLEGIVECPYFWPDGTIIDTAGYDKSTGLFYSPEEELKDLKVPLYPTREQAEYALNTFSEPFIDFPFQDSSSKDNALGLALTPFIRPFLKGLVPLALIDGTKQGTGKGLLVNVISLITTGKTACFSTVPQGDDEWRKRITSLLLMGFQIIVFDNLTQGLESGVLCSAITAETWQDRHLGVNQILNLSQNAIWIATGNNIQVRGDLSRRAYWIRLNAKESQPWLRKNFLHPHLHSWVKEDRKKLVEAGLTIIRYWFVSGKPIGKNIILGSFEEWSRNIGGILSNVGASEFLANSSELYQIMDVETSEWEGFLIRLHKLFGERYVSVKEIVSAFNNDPDLQDNIPSELVVDQQGILAGSFKLRLGKAFEKRNGTRFGNDQVYVERGPKDKHSNTSTWRIGCG